MRTRGKVVLVTVAVAVGLLPATYAVDAAWDAVTRRAAQARWPEEQAQVERARDAVRLSPRFEVVPCASLVGATGVGPEARCWRFEGTPASAIEELVTALGAAGVDDPVAECPDGPLDDLGQPLACVVAGEVAHRRVAAVLFREPNEHPVTPTPAARPVDAAWLAGRAGMFAATSTVLLGADLSAP